MRRVIPLRGGPGLAESRARAGGRRMPPMRDAPEDWTDGLVLASSRERAAVPDRSIPAALPGLRDGFGERGWTWEVGYSRAVVPAILYAASAKSGKAGQVRRPAREVEAVSLRVRRPECRAYGVWVERRWAGGGALTADGVRHLSREGDFRALLDGG